MNKIADIKALAGHFEIYYDKSVKENPYKIYLKDYAYNQSAGRWMERRKLQIKYADLASCLTWLRDYMYWHNEYHRQGR